MYFKRVDRVDTQRRRVPFPLRWRRLYPHTKVKMGTTTNLVEEQRPLPPTQGETPLFLGEE